MTDRNDLLSNDAELNVVSRLELSRHAMMVAQAPAAFIVRCLQGGVWITQETRREDFLLRPGECFEALPRKRVFLDAFRGAVLALCGTAPCRVDSGNMHPGARGLRLKVAQGAYRATGGDQAPLDVATRSRGRQDRFTGVEGQLE